jgi:hypothetical protein
MWSSILDRLSWMIRHAYFSSPTELVNGIGPDLKWWINGRPCINT